MKKRWYGIPAVLVVFLLIFAVVIRMGYTDSEGTIGNYYFNAVNEQFGEDIKDAGQRAESLLSEAELVVRVHPTGERTVASREFYTTIQVDQVYKGDVNLRGKSLYFINELAVQDTVDTPVIVSMNCALPMQKDAPYILLLKKMRFHPQRKVQDWQKNQYYAVTNSVESIFRISNQKQTKVFPDFENQESGKLLYTLDDMKTYDCPAKDEKQLKLFYALRDSVFQKIGLHV